MTQKSALQHSTTAARVLHHLQQNDAKAAPKLPSSKVKPAGQTSAPPPGAADVTLKYRVPLVPPSPFGLANADDPRASRETPPTGRVAALRRQYTAPWHKSLDLAVPPDLKLPKAPMTRAPGPTPPTKPPASPKVDLAPYSPHLDLPETSRQFVDAEPPEIANSRPRPGPLSRGALGPRKALDTGARYTAHYNGPCTEGEECPCELCRGGACEEGTCLPSEPGPEDELGASVIEALASATLKQSVAVVTLVAAAGRLVSLVG